MSGLSFQALARQGDFELDAGFKAESGITCLFGRSGSGKTSIVNLIAGLSRPQAGRIATGDTILFDSESGIDLKPEARRLGYVFQEGRLFPHMDVRRNLLFGLKRNPRADALAGLDQVVELLGIAHLLDRRPHGLSGGEKQRVAIGRALLANPRLLLMDEPLAALDQGRKNEVLPFIAKLAREFKIPIVYVSHAMDEVLQLADTMVLLEAGKVAAAGRLEDVLSDIRLKPLTGRYDAGAVLQATIDSHDEAFQLTHLRLAGGARLKVGHVDAALGSEVRLRIHARDVGLALTPPWDISIQNILPCMVADILEGDGHLADVALKLGENGDGPALWAQVTRYAVANLGIKPGGRLFAMIKAISIARADVAKVG
jgi:molybdate transport system ATP-binding protein